LIALIDVDGSFIYASPSHSSNLHLSMQEIQMSNFYNNVILEDRERVRNSVQQLLREQIQTLKIEYRLQVNDKPSMYVESSISPIYNEDRMIEKLTVVTRDITERKESEQVIYHLA